MRKPTKQNVEALAKQYGAEPDHYLNGTSFGDDYNYILPAGKVWVETGTHAIHTVHYAGQEPIATAWQDLIEQMEAGIMDCEDCEEGTCDYAD